MVPLAESELGEHVLIAFQINDYGLVVWMEEAWSVGHDECYVAEVLGVVRAQTCVGCGKVAVPLLNSELVCLLGTWGGIE